MEETENIQTSVYRYGLKNCTSEFLAYGCEEGSQVVHVVRKHTMWYRTYSCITVLIFVALHVLSAVKNGSYQC
jgi:hypothetical protein